MRSALLILTLLPSSLGCAPPVEVEEDIPIVTEEGKSLLKDLVGNWRVEGTQTSTCPLEWTTSFPQGETRWSESEGQLLVEDLDGNAPNLRFWPIDHSSMGLSLSISQGDCEGVQDLTLEFTQSSGSTLQGVFTSKMDVEFGSLCPISATQAFPCSTQFSWQALRR